MADAVMGAVQSAGLEPLPGEACAGGRCEESSPSEALLSAVLHSDAQSQNSTEPAKTYKVSCDRRNITGIERFTVLLLNASQVPVHHRSKTGAGVSNEALLLAETQYRTNITV